MASISRDGLYPLPHAPATPAGSVTRGRGRGLTGPVARPRVRTRRSVHVPREVNVVEIGGSGARAPRRTVHQGDGVAWLAAAAPLPPDHAIVTSLPDHSELPELGLDGWRTFFEDVAASICGAVADGAVAVFYQTDVKHDGRWIDKAYLVQRAAERAGSHLLWHRIVCRVPAGTTTFGRPAYAHLLCFSRALRLPAGASAADVLPALGEMTWPRAMGRAACEAVTAFLVAHTGCRTVVDPFCGLGTMLAAANAAGLDAVGVERSPKRAERARRLLLEPGRRARLADRGPGGPCDGR